MPSAVSKFFDSPLQFTNESFDKLVIKEEKKASDLLNHVLSACKNELKTGGLELLEKLPLLNEHNLKTMPDGTIVRYRCMIQDMKEEEFYLALYYTTDGTKPNAKQLRCSLWRENLDRPDNHELCNFDDCEDGFDRAEVDDRMVFVGSSIPAETAWVSRYPAQNSASPASSGSSRNGYAVRQCLVKVYDGKERIELNNVIEFIGIFYAAENPEAGATAKASEEFLSMEDEMDSMPRLHAFHFEKVIHHHPELTLSRTVCDEHQCRNQLLRTLNGDIPAFRSRLIDIFKEYLFNGDDLASEYLLCSLIASVHSRQLDSAVGKFCLNICNVFEKDVGAEWASIRLLPFLEQLLTQVAYFPLSLSSLNGASLVPKKCYEAERLDTTRLQLAKSTVLIVDETKLEVGQLNPQGVKNMVALGNVIKWQKLDYDFGQYTCDYVTDVRTLIISDGPTILPTDFALPLRVQATSSGNGQQCPIMEEKAFLDASRIYFAVAPCLTFKIDDAMQNQIQEDFVEMRRDPGKGVTADYLHRLLTLAKLLSLSSGDSRLRVEIWDKAKQLESNRLERLKK